MPANLPPDYFSAEKRFREAKSIDEKIAILEEMMAIMPKHKGTDRLHGDLKRKMAKLKESKETQKKSGTRKEHWQIEKEGAGQVVVVGAPNSGKSQLIRALTNAEPQVADYPFTTRAPVPGMMKHEDIQIQLIELPALTKDVMETWLPNAIFMANFMIIVIDLSSDKLLEDIEAVFDQIEKRRIKIVSDIPEAEEPGYRYIRSLIIGNKFELPASTDNLALLQEWLSGRIKVVPCSAADPSTCRRIPEEIFKSLHIIRVYPKRPGKKLLKEDPLVMPAGSTVIEAAKELHKDIAAKLKFARGWGEGIYDGQHLARDFVLKDGFILEFH